MSQMSEQEKKIPEEKVKWRWDKQPRWKDVRVIIEKMIQDIRKQIEATIEKLQEIFNKEIEDLKII